MMSNGSIIVSWDFSNGKDYSILLVGQQKNGVVNVINAIQGEEAEELYKRLVVPSKTQKTSFAKGEEK